MSEHDADTPQIENEPAEPTPAEIALDLTDVATVEAILFTTDSALSAAKIADVADLPSGRRGARAAVEQLNERYAQMGCSFRIEPQAGGYRMLTLPEFNDVLSRLLKVRSATKLSHPALETLAIVAYRQPILRADIEAIRGVASGEMLRSLMDKGLIRIVGRAEQIGRPMLYGTTRQFLETFGMASLRDLPKVDELAIGATAPPAVSEAQTDDERSPSDNPNASSQEEE